MNGITRDGRAVLVALEMLIAAYPLRVGQALLNVVDKDDLFHLPDADLAVALRRAFEKYRDEEARLAKIKSDEEKVLSVWRRFRDHPDAGDLSRLRLFKDLSGEVSNRDGKTIISFGAGGR